MVPLSVRNYCECPEICNNVYIIATVTNFRTFQDKEMLLGPTKFGMENLKF